MAQYASVYPLVSGRAIARPFTYLADGLEKGSVVSVPFGRATRRGVVVDLVPKPPPEIEPKEVERVLDVVPSALVDLALWIADYYGSTPARALQLVAPSTRKRRSGARRREQPADLGGEPPPEQLTERQQAAVARIVGALEGESENFLLFGETGSGKTEVYLQAAHETLQRGRSAIVLVPEIALTPQAAGRFRARFGERIAVLHSGLTEAERRDERERIQRGEAPLVIGARSAIFAPLTDLGLVCVDEEHDPSYKHESDPRYDARTVAAKRAALEGAVAVFGSATPRPESWHAVPHIELGGRLGGSLPTVQVVDLRLEQSYPISSPLLAELGRLADRGGKAILLLNRRGMAPALHCRACGTTIRCPDCDVSFTLHADRRLHCHHCGRTTPAPTVCTVCGSPEIVRLGAGTEKLEHLLAEQLPELERVRLDADTVDSPIALTDALARFASADRAILLGTQMVAKGHHFEGVEFAAVVDADMALALPDFRAEERMFQLITQLAGRSGRHSQGRVIVQTFAPDARPVRLAARHAVEEFLVEEIERRRELGYPPFRHLVSVIVSGESEGPPIAVLEELRGRLADSGADLLGPAPLLRLRNQSRAQLLAKTEAPRQFASGVGRLLSAAAPAMRRDGLSVAVDVDPQTW